MISNYILLIDFQFLLTYCTVYISAVLIFTPEIGDFQKCQAVLHFETLCQMRKLFFSTTFQGLTRYGNIENKTTFQGLTRYGTIDNIFLNIYIAVSCWSLTIWEFEIIIIYLIIVRKITCPISFEREYHHLIFLAPLSPSNWQTSSTSTLWFVLCGGRDMFIWLTGH